jgi:4-amino-4-deoxy-L-arabinose transferase-like glycosyltransferase
MEYRDGSTRGTLGPASASYRRNELIVLLFAAAIFLISVISPPALMDDVDSVQAQIARTMLQSGDWVTARLDGVAYLEKSPLKYWLIAICFQIFGVHDWVARVPVALAAILLCWVTARFTRWGIGDEAGSYAGLTLATSVGLFLFTRVLIPDVILTLTITLTLWALMRAMDNAEPHRTLWAMTGWAAMAGSVLLKGLIGILFPVGAAGLYLVITGLIWNRETWRRLQILPGILLFLLLAAPWHVLATIRNPPYFDFTMHSESGSYRGFFWFYFFNEHILRFLDKRWPRDYNTVPRPLFWLFHLVWFFPWSVYFPAVRAGGSKLLTLAACWVGFVMVFFTFSTTQEYYSMPCYPAIAILLGAAMASSRKALRPATKVAGGIAALLCVVLTFLLVNTRGIATPGEISQALTSNPDIYTLSLGHMADLTFQAFAYLRVPLALAAVATLLGALGAFFFNRRKAYLALALMMVMFFQAARLALITFNPTLGSRPLAEALLRSPKGKLIVDDQYYTFSSVFFYANTTALLLNGRVNNLEYGSYAPDAPKVFISDSDFSTLWKSSERYYLVAEVKPAERIHKLVDGAEWDVVAETGGKLLITNRR